MYRVILVCTFICFFCFVHQASLLESCSFTSDPISSGRACILSPGPICGSRHDRGTITITRPPIEPLFVKLVFVH